MRKSIIISLLAGVALPLSAYAQDSGTTPPAGGETMPPAASDGAAPTTTAPSDDAATSTTGAAAPAEDAGTMSDTQTAPAGSMDSSSDSAATMDDSAPAADGAPASDGAMTADSGPFVTVPPTGAWRATDLEGKDVYDTQGEDIGEITDVLLSEDGKVMAVLVGVGGFLGIGEKDVAVSMSALEFGPGKTEGLKTEEEVNAAASASSGAGGTGMAGGTAGGTGMAGDTSGGMEAAPAATAEPQEPVVGEDNLPDRIVLNVSREQLESAPAYGEPEEEGEDDAASTTAPTDPASGDASQPAAGAVAPAN